MSDGVVMPDAPPRALIFMTARNCQRHVRAAIESIAWQTHASLHVLFVDDCSEDGTPAAARSLLAAHLPGRHTFVRNPQPWGKARNAHVHLRAALPRGDFVALLDADDQLIRASVVSEMASEYANGHDVVWTTFETDTGHAGSGRPLDPLQPPRGQGWRDCGFFSFRAELFDQVPEHYLRDDRGQWWPAACDQAIAMPVLDQTRRYKFLPVSALRQTTGHPDSHQAACAGQIQARMPLPCTRWAFGDGAGGDEALFALRETLHAELRSLAGTVDAAVLSRPTPARASHGAPAAMAGQETDDVWAQAAAADLSRRCPALLHLMMDGQGQALSTRDAWRWWTWLQSGGRPPAVLEVGAGPLAAAVCAMAQALGGRFLSACADRERALALWARLESAGLSADVIHVPLVQAALDGRPGRIADLSALPSDAAGYDVLLTSTAAGSVADDSILTLPMAVDRLDPDGFRVCLWAPDDPALRRDVVSAWRALAPELKFTENAFAGQAICVQPA